MLAVDTPATRPERAEPSLPRRAFSGFRKPGRLPDFIAYIAYIVGGFYVTSRLWGDLPNRVTASNEQDYAFFQFVLMHAAHALVSAENPFFNAQLNAPHGVNMMANTSMLGISIPLAPITLWLGPSTSFAVAMVGAFAGTATAWYVVLRRHVTANRTVAFISAGFCAFAPGMVSHANAHPNIVAQFMLPLIISRVIRMRESARPIRDGVLLGLMLTYQMFLNEELLLYTAMACLVMAVVYVGSRPEEVRAVLRSFLTGSAVAVGVFSALLAYPLWYQFFGPQHYTGPFWWAGIFGTDLAAYVGYATESIGGDPVTAGRLAANPTEENAFFGWPLCGLAIVIGIVLFRLMAARLALIVGLVFMALSLGNEIKVAGKLTGIAGPWKLVSALPLFDSVIVSRLALVVAAAIGVLLAVGGGWVVCNAMVSFQDHAARTRALGLWLGGLVAVLLPIAPTPLPSANARTLPAFIATGRWQQYVDDGTVVPVPPETMSTDAIRWVVAAELGFRIADGYFLGPESEHDTTARFGAPERPTGSLLRQVALSGAEPEITESHREQALADLRHWQADVLVLARASHREALRRTVDALIGRSGEEIDGAVVWDVRGLT